jgi:hypothetical protein
MPKERRPTRLKKVPEEASIEEALKAVCTSPRGWKIRDTILVGLDCTQKHMPEESDRLDDFSDAVREYLEEALGKEIEPHNRVILEVVLGLGDDKWRGQEWRKLSAMKRREEAGRLFRSEEGVVQAGTIRQLHEPRAREELAAIIWRDEKRARDEL